MVTNLSFYTLISDILYGRPRTAYNSGKKLFLSCGRQIKEKLAKSCMSVKNAKNLSKFNLDAWEKAAKKLERNWKDLWGGIFFFRSSFLKNSSNFGLNSIKVEFFQKLPLNLVECELNLKNYIEHFWINFH